MLLSPLRQGKRGMQQRCMRYRLRYMHGCNLVGDSTNYRGCEADDTRVEGAKRTREDTAADSRSLFLHTRSERAVWPGLWII